MRIRQKKNNLKTENNEVIRPEVIEVEELKNDSNSELKKSNGAFRFVKKMIANPNLGFQIMVIILTLTSDDERLERRIDGMNTTVGKIRSITEMLNKTMGSVKIAAETPKKIRQLFDEDLK
ncbi:hypothetical protein [Anaerosinus sp.]|uniref:hypothetical protein n=1 Tax=Selenobaculum sp. TaxID=3074374 RepID=UPI0015B167C0